MIGKILKNYSCLAIKSKNKVRNFFYPTARILLYHRIADVKDDPYLLSVSPKNFSDQIQFLKTNFNLVSLGTLILDLKNSRLKNRTIAITFDDGYEDNFSNALPILEKLNAPATIFITAGKIDSPESFYWDEKSAPKDRGRALTAEELQRLASSPLIEIGSHTLTHQNLAKEAVSFQKKEIGESKKILEGIVKKPVLGFAYPFGSKDSFTLETINLVKKAGYQYACANIHERTRRNSDIFTLPRFIVRNWNLKEFKDSLKKFI